MHIRTPCVSRNRNCFKYSRFNIFFFPQVCEWLKWILASYTSNRLDTDSNKWTPIWFTRARIENWAWKLFDVVFLYEAAYIGVSAAAADAAAVTVAAVTAAVVTAARILILQMQFQSIDVL